MVVTSSQWISWHYHTKAHVASSKKVAIVVAMSMMKFQIQIGNIQAPQLTMTRYEVKPIVALMMSRTTVLLFMVPVVKKVSYANIWALAIPFSTSLQIY